MSLYLVAFRNPLPSGKARITRYVVESQNKPTAIAKAGMEHERRTGKGGYTIHKAELHLNPVFKYASHRE